MNGNTNSVFTSLSGDLDEMEDEIIGFDEILLDDNDNTNETVVVSSTNERDGGGHDLNKIFFLSVLISLILVGNFYILASILGRGSRWNRRNGGFPVKCSKLSRLHFFMLHLCIADVLTALITLGSELFWTLTMPHFYGGSVMCKVVKFVQMIGPYSSSYVIAMTSIDRFNAICHPFQSTSVVADRRSRTLIKIAWIVSFVLCIPQTIIFTTVTKGGSPWPGSLRGQGGTTNTATIKSHEPLPGALKVGQESTTTKLEITTLSSTMIQSSNATTSPIETSNIWEEGRSEDVRELGETRDVSVCKAIFVKDWGQKAYVTWFAISNFIFPLLMISYFYVRICCELCSKNRLHGAESNSSETSVERSQHHSSSLNNNTKSVAVPDHQEVVIHQDNNIPMANSSKTEFENNSTENYCSWVNNVNAGRKSSVVSFSQDVNITDVSFPLADVLKKRKKSSMSFRSETDYSYALIRSAKQTVVIISMYVLCSMPFVVIQLWHVWAQPDKNQVILMRVFFWLMPLNSAINPLIYITFNRELKSPFIYCFKRLKELIVCRRCQEAEKKKKKRSTTITDDSMQMVEMT